MSDNPKLRDTANASDNDGTYRSFSSMIMV
jgi:hypothetical protein